MAHAALVVAHGSARDVHGFEGSRMGGVGGRLEPCEGHRWLRCALKRHGQFCCGTRSRSHTRGQSAESGTRVVVGWWDRRCAREGLGNYRYICGITSTYVVAEAYMRSTGSVGSDTWPHTHGEGCTRRARGRSEQRATDASKNIGVFCGYTLVSGLSRGYTRSGGGTRGSDSGVRSAL